MIDIKGKGYFLWQVRLTDKGDVVKQAQLAKDAGLTHVIIKISDGVGGYNNPPLFGDYAKKLAHELRLVGIEPWGFQYVYGYNPEREARKALQRIREVGVDVFIINAEREMKTSGANAARRYLNVLMGEIEIPVGLSSYRFPETHPELPWNAYVSAIDFMMPQVYWMGAHNAGEQLIRSYNEYQKLCPQLPYIPTGAAFCEHGWCSTEKDVVSFLDMAKNGLELQAVNFWEWRATRTHLPKQWAIISNFQWSDTSIPIPSVPLNEWAGYADEWMRIKGYSGPKPE